MFGSLATIPEKYAACASVLLPAAVAIVPAPLMAQESAENSASASLVQPLVITGAQPLEFGTLAIPTAQTCLYAISPTGQEEASGVLCQFIAGEVLPAGFTLNCAAGSLVQFEVIYIDSAPAGARFSAPEAAMSIDGQAVGSVYQVGACDADGTSEIRAGGLLEVSAQAQHDFSGRVGTIRLEVAYN